jgi:AcrR family transcriptional regulator
VPRVSDEHLELRRQQILDAAQRCFIRKGVHATSMQDIIAESELSAGALYRYFKSKSDIIRAIVSGVIGDMHSFLADLVTADPLLPLDEIVLRVARHIATVAQAGGVFRLAPQAWGLATVDPELRAFVNDHMTSVREQWIVYARRCVREGMLPPGTDPVATGKTVFSLLPGFLLQHLITEDVDPEEIVAGLRALLTPTLTGQAPAPA